MSVSATTNGIRPGVCLSTAKPSNPFIGQVIYMSDTDETAVWDGTYWEGLNRSRDRNVLINGAMQIHQRGTSTASITTSGYYTSDRWRIGLSSMGTWTQSVENDAPTGSGFRKSLKILCTTADASPAAADIVLVDQGLEGQNVQHFFKGTASARSFTLSFWVKSNVTGTYIAELIDSDNTRQVSASYTITAVDTWQRKIITFPADTTGAFDNDNARSLTLSFGLGAGSNATSGTLNTVWGATTNANQYVGQTNVASAVNNYWQVTGVQLEAGSAATPFEFEGIGTTIEKCQRYFQTYTDPPLRGVAMTDTRPSRMGMILPVPMRVAPTSYSFSGTLNFWDGSTAGSYSSVHQAFLRSTHIEFDFNLTVGYTAGRAIVLYINNNGIMTLTAEL